MSGGFGWTTSDRETAVATIDARLGEWLEGRVMRHHRRRLERVDRGRVLGATDGWASAGSPPRPGCDVRVLVDGAEALPEIAAAIDSATSFVWLAGWFFSPQLGLGGRDGPSLRELLTRTAERVEVRVLGWAGSPLPLFHPDRAQVRAMAEAMQSGSRVRLALDARERPLHCHHEKLVIVDGQVAFVGGIDLTSYGGDRFDTSGHPARGSIGWHDVAARICGPAVADVTEHFRMRWREVSGELLGEVEPPAATGNHEVQVVRTVPERIYQAVPRGEFGILETYLGVLRSAGRFIYLENQFLWSPEIVAVLEEKLLRPPDERFRILVLLPAKPNNGNDDTRGQLGRLVRADGGAGRLLACTLHQTGLEARPVYVHAKLAIVDDEWLILGSANLNEHSLFNDTEVNVVSSDPALAEETRLRLWAEHLDVPVAELGGDPVATIDGRWRPVAEEQHARRRAGRPLTHRLVRLPHLSRRSEALRGPLNGLLVDG